jgi:hypothetical protein
MPKTTTSENDRYICFTMSLSEAEAELFNRWVTAQDPPLSKSALIRNCVLAELKASGIPGSERLNEHVSAAVDWRFSPGR